jgi:hypothetical protein
MSLAVRAWLVLESCCGEKTSPISKLHEHANQIRVLLISAWLYLVLQDLPHAKRLQESAMPNAAMLCRHCEGNAILQQAVSIVGGGKLGANVEMRLIKFLLRKELPLLCSWPRL